MKPEETIDFPIRKVWSRISRIYNSEASKYGGTMAIGQILLSVDPDGTPSTKLGPKMGMESRSLVRTLQTMEDAGLIRRAADTSDGRVVRIHLTTKGKSMRDVSRNTVDQIQRSGAEPFHADSTQQLPDGDDRAGSDTGTRTTLLRISRKGAKTRRRMTNASSICRKDPATRDLLCAFAPLRLQTTINGQ